MSILVDSKVVSAVKRPSSTTPRNVVYQLYFVTAEMISSEDICGGIISSQKHDSFCAKSVESCKSRSHERLKHKMFKSNTIYIIAKSTSGKPNASDKIVNPIPFHLNVQDEHANIARKLIIISNEKLYGSKSYESACSVFNQFCEDFHVSVNRKSTPDDDYQMELEPRKVDSDSGLFPSFVQQEEIGHPFASKMLKNVEISPFLDTLDLNGADSSSSSSASTSIGSESLKPTDHKSDNIKVNDFTMPENIDDQYILRGMQLGADFELDPTRQIALLGAFLLKQEDTIKQLSNTVQELREKDTISHDQLDTTLSPIKNNLRTTMTLTERTKLAFDKHKKKMSGDKIKAALRQEILEELEEKLSNVREDIVESIEENNEDIDITDKIRKLEIKLLAMESSASATPSIFPIGSTTSPLIPDLVRKDIAKLEFKLALMESRVGAQTIKFGNISLQSLADAELFVNDKVPSFSYGCFFDLVALLDSLRDTTTTEKSYLESEYNAQKTKFVSVDEASTSASFLHVAPLVFCGSSTSSDSKYGSIERSLPHVKTRDHWVSLGGMEGMKRQLEEEVLSKVGSILEEIPMTLGDSEGASLAKSYLMASQTCFHKFVNWTETFYQELLGTSQATEKEAWMLILHCWMAFFTDLRQIRMSCANLSPGRHEVGTAGRTRIVARYIWTMGRAIALQNEYCDKQFRNHPSIATVINYHLFQHRVPMTLYKTTIGKMDSEVKGINAWKAQIGREIKEIRKIASDRS